MANNRLFLVATKDGTEVARLTIGKRMGAPDWYHGPVHVNDIWDAVRDAGDCVVALEFEGACDDAPDGFTI